MLKIIMANKGVRNAKDVKSIETNLTIAQVMDAIKKQEEMLTCKKTSEDRLADIKMNRYRGK